MSSHVKIVGDQRLRDNLFSLSEGADPVTTRSLDEVAGKIRDTAKEYAPVDTESLKKSISKQKIVVRGKVKSIRVTAGGRITNPKTGRLVDYAAPQEFGTSRMVAHPFMRPAYTEHRKELVKAAMKGLIARLK